MRTSKEKKLLAKADAAWAKVRKAEAKGDSAVAQAARERFQKALLAVWAETEAADKDGGMR